MQSSGSWEALRAEGHPAGVIKEPLPDLFQDQGPKHIYLFNSRIFEELHTKDFWNACSGAGGRPQALAPKVRATKSQQLLGAARPTLLQSWGLAAQLLARAWGWSPRWFPLSSADVERSQFPKRALLCLFLCVSATGLSCNTSPRAPCGCHPSRRGTRPKTAWGGERRSFIDQRSQCQAKPSAVFPPAHHARLRLLLLKKIPAGRRNRHAGWMEQPTERDARRLWGQAL